MGYIVSQKIITLQKSTDKLERDVVEVIETRLTRVSDDPETPGTPKCSLIVEYVHSVHT